MSNTEVRNQTKTVNAAFQKYSGKKKGFKFAEFEIEEKEVVLQYQFPPEFLAVELFSDISSPFFNSGI